MKISDSVRILVNKVDLFKLRAPDKTGCKRIFQNNFSYFSKKTCCDPSLGPSNGRSQRIFYEEKICKIIPKPAIAAVHSLA